MKTLNPKKTSLALLAMALWPVLPVAAQPRPPGTPEAQRAQAPVLPEAVQRRAPELPPLLPPSDLAPTLQFRVGQSLVNDDNVFRSPEASRRSDSYGITTLGAKLDKRYSLQRLELDVYAQDYRYADFSELDFTALNYDAAWRWSVTPRLRGNLTADQREFVDNTADVLTAPGVLGSVNRRTESALGLDAEYEVGAAWRVVGGVYGREVDNTRTLAEADSRVSGAELGVRHVWSSGNALAYRFRNGDGEYRGQAGAGLPQDFTDTEHEVRLEWAPSGRSNVQGRLAQLEREHAGAPDRDFSGLTGRVSATWAVTGKTQLEAGFVSELGSYQTASSNYYEGQRLYINPVWRPTEKTALRLRLEQGTRNYKGAPAGQVPLNRRDTISLAGIGIEWQALRSLTLALTAEHDRRTSNTASAEYRANTVGLSALLRF